MTRMYLVAAIGLAALTTPSVAQTIDPALGSRIRFTARGITTGRTTAVVVERHGDTLHVVPEHGAPVVVRLDQLSSLEISRGKSALLGAQTGALWTGGIYAGLGVVLAVAAQSVCDYGCDSPNVFGTVAYFALSGAVVGGGIGAIIGRERWERMETSQRISVRPIIGRRLGVSLQGVF